MKKRKYEPYNYYKKFKLVYKEFVLFIKNGEYYMTYDRDAKIVSYICKCNFEKPSLAVSKWEFRDLLSVLHNVGLNVVLSGAKKCQEYYTVKESNYTKIWGKAKQNWRVTRSSEESIR